jgi:methionyl-tRNA formyltransferase
LGIHGSLLPRLRGFAPVNWALLRDEPETGPSLFYFDEGMDTGDLVGQRPFALTDEDDAESVRKRIADASVELLREHLAGLAAGTAPRTPQPLEGATYGERRRPEDGAIDWTRSAREIFNRVRGLTRPYPGAFGFVGGEKVNVWKVRPVGGEGIAPGGVVTRDGEVFVGTGSGEVRIVDCAMAGDDGPGDGERAREVLTRAGRFDVGESR